LHRLGLVFLRDWLVRVCSVCGEGIHGARISSSSRGRKCWGGKKGRSNSNEAGRCVKSQKVRKGGVTNSHAFAFRPLVRYPTLFGGRMMG
jgi:hypothetical protein